MSRHQNPDQFSVSKNFKHLTLPLAPLYSVSTGLPHPSFPRTLLHYYLLTESELDDLAHYYHQRTPQTASWQYPEYIAGRWNCAGGVAGVSEDDVPNDRPDKSVEAEKALEEKMGEGKIQKIDSTSVVCAAQVKDKRRRFGRFVGLRGCESPKLVAFLPSNGRWTIGVSYAGELKTTEEWLEWCKMQKEIKSWVAEKVRAGMVREEGKDLVLREGW